MVAVPLPVLTTGNPIAKGPRPIARQYQAREMGSLTQVPKPEMGFFPRFPSLIWSLNRGFQASVGFLSGSQAVKCMFIDLEHKICC